MIQLIECPRDAMQGIKEHIDTDLKATYINALLKVGFHTIDFGSFVSPKAIPQMADTAKVLEKLDLSATSSKLLAIIANIKGAEMAVQHPEITYLGYPFSISETFQQRNTKRGIDKAYEDLKVIQSLCEKHGKKLVAYLSMGFGNPYGDPWNTEVVAHWTEKLADLGIEILALSDTVGNAKEADIRLLFETLPKAFPKVTFGAHLHAGPHDWKSKVEAAYQAGCRRFDAAMKGFGGCPMAKDDLVGNVATENLIPFFKANEADFSINQEALQESLQLANRVFLT